jgi:hypothetical protein
MTIHIPDWLLWTLGLGMGIPSLFLVLFLAYLGVQFVRMFSRGIY